MSINRQQRIEQIFHLASDLPKVEQTEFVNQQLQGDPKAIAEVLELLATDNQDSVVLERILNSPQQISKAVIQDHQLERVGAYLIEKEISHGGMGRVFLGRRDDEAYESLVAIKLVRVEKNSEWAEKRFLEERQILARLNHPNIATLLDGGTTDQGQPYVVMQYIDGQAVNDYCQNTALNLQQKLKLFIKICQAVSYAHKNLVIHRDIKPANILVDHQGEPKLLDFGIAKIISDELNAGDVTQMGIMTPSYASPEQVRGEVISTSSDIYSLGVLLYELLAEQPPFDVGSGSPAEIVKAVCNTEPVRPSAIVSEPVMAKSLQGDLDNIILKAMQKDPAQRYGSADEFISDIQRYLSGHAVIAAGNSKWYKTKKFCLRHWLSISAASLFLISIAGLTSFYTIKLANQRDRAIEAEKTAKAATALAKREAETANQVTGFITSLFKANNPNADSGSKDMTAKQLLDAGLKKLPEALNNQPQTKAHLLRTIGIAYANLGEIDLGITQLRASLDLHQQHSTGLVQAEAMNRLANLLRQADLYQEAANMHQQAIALHESHSAKPTWELADSYNNYGLLIFTMGQYKEAKNYFRKAINMHRKVAGGDIDSVGINLHNLSLVTRSMGQYEEAEKLIKESLAVLEKFRGRNSTSWIISYQTLGRIQNNLGQYKQAVVTLDEAIVMGLKHYQPDNQRMGSAWFKLANSHQALGNFELAEQYYQRTIDIYTQYQSKDSPRVARVETQYSQLLAQMGQYTNAEQLLKHSLGIQQKKYIPTHPNIAQTSAELASVSAELDQLTAARKLIGFAINAYQKHFEHDHPELAWARLIQAKIMRLNGQLNAAAEPLKLALSVIATRQHENPVHYALIKYEQALLAADNQSCDDFHNYLEVAESTLKQLNPRHGLLTQMIDSNMCK